MRLWSIGPMILQLGPLDITPEELSWKRRFHFEITPNVLGAQYVVEIWKRYNHWIRHPVDKWWQNKIWWMVAYPVDSITRSWFKTWTWALVVYLTPTRVNLHLDSKGISQELKSLYLVWCNKALHSFHLFPFVAFEDYVAASRFYPYQREAGRYLALRKH